MSRYHYAVFTRVTFQHMPFIKNNQGSTLHIYMSIQQDNLNSHEPEGINGSKYYQALHVYPGA